MEVQDREELKGLFVIGSVPRLSAQGRIDGTLTISPHTQEDIRMLDAIGVRIWRFSTISQGAQTFKP
jgi:hypothetical protein